MQEKCSFSYNIFTNKSLQQTTLKTYPIWNYNNWIELKTLWQKEKLLVLSRCGLSIQGLWVRIPAWLIFFLTFDKRHCDMRHLSFTNGLFNSPYGKAASWLKSMLCDVLVWEYQETHAKVNCSPWYDWKQVENGFKP